MYIGLYLDYVLYECWNLLVYFVVLCSICFIVYYQYMQYGSLFKLMSANGTELEWTHVFQPVHTHSFLKAEKFLCSNRDEVSGSHSGEYEDDCLLGYCTI
jgi:hypothetical protein